ncbi:hypothetical protein [Streptomyces chryseus]|uniref:hypothetical protein n=1 Tax=Streptomyces chryseus TaxID=68186 RepID=UPI00110FB9EB|nr:hypothetical protein [Streptomyces chryseus]GGX40524.1 hypothetical protein GCM10010353_64830 [Streptomyces chryseus]
MERRLLDVLRVALPEQEIKDWGRVYREEVQALGSQIAVVPPVISGLPVATGYQLADLKTILPALAQEHMARTNTAFVDRETMAAGGAIDSASFIQGMADYGFAATVFRRTGRTAAAAQEAGDEQQTEAATAAAPAFRAKLELESFLCIRAVGISGAARTRSTGPRRPAATTRPAPASSRRSSGR